MILLDTNVLGRMKNNPICQRKSYSSTIRAAVIFKWLVISTFCTSTRLPARALIHCRKDHLYLADGVCFIDTSHEKPR